MVVPRLHSRSVTYAATTLGAMMMQSVFMFYYVKVYLHKFHVSAYWFNLSQVIFMLWNAVNDPLFGCLQDSALTCRALRSRRESILYGAPLFVLSFFLTWIPWSDYSSNGSAPEWLSGVQLTVSLCFYDAMFTFVLLAQCAMFTEMSVQQDDRVRLIRYAQVASLLGSTSVFFCESVSVSLDQWSSFITACLVIAVLSLICFVYTGLHGTTHYKPSDALTSVSGDSDMKQEQAVRSCGDDYSWSQFVVIVSRQTFQIFSQRSFLSFISTNFLQIYHMTFLTNFASIICDQLISDSDLSKSNRALFYGSLFIVPQILVIVCSSWVTKFGYFQLIRWSYIIQIILGAALALVGRNSPNMIIIFFVLECAVVSATFSIFNLPLSDIIDVDYKQHSRTNPLSSMVFGLNALVTKPAISLAPMIAVAYFNAHGYQGVQQGATSAPSIASQAGASAAPLSLSHGSSELGDAMFRMIWTIPVVLGLLQLATWSAYTIRDSHKQKQVLYQP